MEDLVDLPSFEKQLAAKRSILLFFWAEWHEPSKKGGQIHEIVSTLSEKYTNIKFLRVEAEIVPEISEKYEISMVPSFVALNLIGEVVGSVKGANPPELIKLLKKLELAPVPTSSTTASASITTVPSKETLNKRLEVLVGSNPVMLFMKGSPQAPKCGFSRTIVEILQTHSVPFSTFDILTDNDVREGLKVYSEWPTYPQLYVAGEFVGGLDIVKEMVSSGQPLIAALGIDKMTIVSKEVSLESRIKELLSKDVVMLFMKGSPDSPKCGFSRTIVEILRQENINFSYFDILTDDDIRSGLKVYSDWPTYPQLYAKGELVGGLDIVKDMIAQGPLINQLNL